MSEYTRKEGETDLELLWRVASEKRAKHMTWDQVAEIMNELTGNNYGESRWRKCMTRYKKQDDPDVELDIQPKNEPVSSYYNGNELNNIDDRIRQLEVAKIQYRDERNAWNKQNYTDARVSQKLDYLEEQLITLGRVNFAEHEKPVINGDNEMIIMLSDWHLGAEFSSFIGEYNSEIAKNRLGCFLQAVKEYALLFNVKKAHIVGLGDLISSSIHKTIQITNRENVIDQVKLATELMSSFCYECTKIFETVLFYNVSGNHSRIDRKDDALHDERLDDLIGWATNLSLSHIENFHFMSQRNLDIGIADINACGHSYIAVHGDYDPATKSGTSNLSMMLGFVPTAILRGHLHVPSFMPYNNVPVIQGGSLSGSGDQYTLEKRLFGPASQTILICDKQGIKVHIPVMLQ